MQDYLACIISVDNNTARMFGYPDESGFAENTIVMYKSDQGVYFYHKFFVIIFMYRLASNSSIVLTPQNYLSILQTRGFAMLM